MSNAINLEPYDLFKITGTDVKGKRNKPRVSENFFYLRCFNYYTKTMWGREKSSGKWRKLYRVVN